MIKLNELSIIVSGLNNREIASFIWIIIVLVCLIVKIPSAVSAGKNVVLALLDLRLIILFGSFAAYIFLCCWLISRIGLWKIDQLFPTIIWVVTSGAITLGQSLSPIGDRRYFEKLFSNNFQIIVFFEFLFVAYTFPLFVELIILPIVTMFSIVSVVGERHSKYEPAAIFSQYTVAVFVLICLIWSLLNIYLSPGDFFTLSTGRNFILPFVLFMLCLPFYYLWYCISNVQNAWIRISEKRFQSDELKKYARRRFTPLFGLRPWLLRRAVSDFQRLPARTESDVEKIIDQIIAKNVRITNPPKVNAERGWRPESILELLSNTKFEMGDYQTSYTDDEWWACSSPVDLDKQDITNTATLYVTGKEFVVEEVKLKGHFLYQSSSELGVITFDELCVELLIELVGVDDISVFDGLFGEENHRTVLGSTSITRETLVFPNNRGFNIIFTLTRGS